MPSPQESREPALRDAAPGIQAIESWLASHRLEYRAVERLPGDVSLRVYHRIRLADGGSRIVAAYPVAMVDAQRRFAAAAALLERAGIRVPRIEIDDPQRRLTLLEDFGRETLYDLSGGWEERPGELAAALELLPALASIPVDEVRRLGCPPLDGDLLRTELARTSDLVLAPRRLDSPAVTRQIELLCGELGAEPLVACHRDLMVRNLVPVAGGLGVLDFQDLRPGPRGYDLASLLNDSFFAGDEIEARAVARFLPGREGESHYRLAAAQRALKAVGTYVSFAERGDRRHLGLVAPTLERAARALSRLDDPRFRDLSRAVDDLAAALAEERLC